MDEHPSYTTQGGQRRSASARESLPTRGDPASLPAVSPAIPAPQSRPPGQPCSVELRIEELVLHGLAAGEQYRVGLAIERELTRLLAEQGTPPSLVEGEEIARLDAGAVEIQPGTDAELTGALLAQAIYGGLG